jgi:hypothetical protein
MPKKRIEAENKMMAPAGSAAVPRRRKSTPRVNLRTVAREAITQPAENSTENAAGAAAEATTQALYEPTHQEIAQLAYSFWEARGRQGGSAEEDWHRAEAQLRARVTSAHA